MTVQRTSVRAVVVPLRHPIIAAIGRYEHWPLVLVDVEMADGVVGSSYIAPYRAKSLPVVTGVIRDLLDGLPGRDVAPGDAFSSALKSLNVVGVSGLTTIAVSAVDMAVWDALAKTAGLPLAQLLGGSIGPVRAYNSNGLWRHEVSTLASEAEMLINEGGFTAVKMRLGNPHLRDDLAAIDAVRQGIGDEVDLMVDFNQALGAGDAIRRCHELDERGLYWFEEPIAYDDVRGYAQLAQQIRTPLQAGENFYGARDLLNFLDRGAVHYAMVDLMRIGGVTGWLQTAGVAAAAGIQLSSHLYPEFAAHLLRVTPTAHWLEWVDWAYPILADPVLPEAGMVTASDQPGAGLVWDERAVQKYTIHI
ncbi:mandelate racemase [Mycobacterium kubicae]|nr:mandelate racemase [Mycobacterium kubicae]